MRLFQRKQKVNGELGYFNLEDWWLTTFSEEERIYIEKKYQPMSIGGGGAKPLTEGHIESTSQTAIGLLSGLASWFRDPKDLSIARRIFVKADEIGGNDPLDVHFHCQAMIEVFYRSRESDPSAFQDAISACEKQIAVAPTAAAAFRHEYDSKLPAHVGYRQLAIIREKQKDYDEAIRLSKEALDAGWDGDWSKRIERCQNRMSK